MKTKEILGMYVELNGIIIPKMGEREMDRIRKYCEENKHKDYRLCTISAEVMPVRGREENMTSSILEKIFIYHNVSFKFSYSNSFFLPKEDIAPLNKRKKGLIDLLTEMLKEDLNL